MRPCKSATLLTPCSQTKKELAARIEYEKQLRGDGELVAPSFLSDNQRYIFEQIISGLEASGILGQQDVYLLTICSIAIDRLQYLEKGFNDNPSLLADKGLLAARAGYSKDFFRCCNELSLSPQSRAKLSNIKMQTAAEVQDPLLAALYS